MTTLYYLKVVDGVAVDRIYAHEPLPPEWFPEGEEWAADDEAQIGWEYENGEFSPPPAEELPPTPILIVPYGTFRARWDTAELEALFEARKVHWQVDDFVSLASAQNAVNLSGATAAEARSLFVSLGVLTAERAEEIFSP